jgi:hypothetical protein
MQTLGLSDSTPRPENRVKTLFWPRVQYAEDAQLLGTQGYWICLILAVLNLLVGYSSHTLAAHSVDAIYYYLGGIGIKQASRFAATSLFLFYLATVISAVVSSRPPGIASVFFIAILLANLRATWLVCRLKREQEHDAMCFSPVSSATLFTDTVPRVVWPFGKWLFYVLTLLIAIGFLFSFIGLESRSRHKAERIAHSRFLVSNIG